MSTPQDHGFELCSRCGTWRRASEVFGDEGGKIRCSDLDWCSSQAGVGRGKLDADTGTPERSP